MPVYRFKDGRKGYYFSFYFEGKKIKKERWNGQSMLTKSEALKCESECKRLLAKYGRRESEKTLYELFEEYLKNSKSNLKPSTLAGYNKFKRNYLMLIEDVLISKLKPSHFLEWKFKIKKLDLTVPFKNRLLRTMQSILNYGMLMYDMQGKLQVSLLEPFREESIVNIPTTSKHLLEADFLKMLEPLKEQLNYSNGLYYYTILNVLYYTGIRIGELSALEVKDYKNGYIYINKDYIRVEQRDIIQPPKSVNSIRRIKLDNRLIDILERYIEVYKPVKILFSLKGEYLNQPRLRRVLHKLGEEMDLHSKYEIKIHNLRHSHASNLRLLGFDEIVIAKRLGNTPKISATVYMHALDEEDEEIAKKIENNQK